MTASQESLKLDESFTSLAKHKYSVSFGALSVADEGIDDLEESFNLGGFPALDIGRPKVSKKPGEKNQVKISSKKLTQFDWLLQIPNVCLLCFGGSCRIPRILRGSSRPWSRAQGVHW